MNGVREGSRWLDNPKEDTTSVTNADAEQANPTFCNAFGDARNE